MRRRRKGKERRWDGDDHRTAGEVAYLTGAGTDQLLGRTGGGFGTTDWYLTDAQGSVRRVIDSADGSFQGSASYDATGNRSAGSSTNDRFGYTSRDWDETIGLQYNRARYYDPELGRWTQEDPIGFGGGDMNLYRYVGNSPVNYTDPSGLAADGFSMWDYVPVVGPIRAASNNWENGEYGWMIVNVAMALTDVIPAKAALTSAGKAAFAGGKAALKGVSRSGAQELAEDELVVVGRNLARSFAVSNLKQRGRDAVIGAGLGGGSDVAFQMARNQDMGQTGIDPREVVAQAFRGGLYGAYYRDNRRLLGAAGVSAGVLGTGLLGAEGHWWMTSTSGALTVMGASGAVSFPRYRIKNYSSMSSLKIAEALEKRPAGKALFESLNSGGALESKQLQVRIGPNDRLLGGVDVDGNMMAFSRATRTVQKTAETLVHESVHAQGVAGSQQAELIARVAQFLYANNNRPPTANDINAIIAEMKYAESRSYPGIYSSWPLRRGEEGTVYGVKVKY